MDGAIQATCRRARRGPGPVQDRIGIVDAVTRGGAAVSEHVSLTANWWVPVVRGVCAVVFGILAFLGPGATFGALVLLFGAYALIEAVVAVVAAVTGRPEQRSRWLSLLGGVLSILAGVAVFSWPGLTALTLVYVIGAWAVATGILRVIAAFALHDALSGEWLLGLSGVLSVLAGL